MDFCSTAAVDGWPPRTLVWSEKNTPKSFYGPWSIVALLLEFYVVLQTQNSKNIFTTTNIYILYDKSNLQYWESIFSKPEINPTFRNDINNYNLTTAMNHYS